MQRKSIYLLCVLISFVCVTHLVACSAEKKSALVMNVDKSSAESTSDGIGTTDDDSNLINKPVNFQNVIDSCWAYRVAVTEDGDIYHWVAEQDSYFGISNYTDSGFVDTSYNENIITTSPQKLEKIGGVASISLSDKTALAVKFDGTVWMWNYVENIDSDSYSIRNLDYDDYYNYLSKERYFAYYDISDPILIENLENAKYAYQYTYSEPIYLSEYKSGIVSRFPESWLNPYPKIMISGIIVVKNDGTLWFTNQSEHNEIKVYDNKSEATAKSANISYISSDIAIGKDGNLYVVRYDIALEKLFLEELQFGTYYVPNNSKSYSPSNDEIIVDHPLLEKALYVVDANVSNSFDSVVYLENRELIFVYMNMYGNGWEVSANNEGVKFFSDYRYIDMYGDVYTYDGELVMDNERALYIKDRLILTASGHLYESKGGLVYLKMYDVNSYKSVLEGDVIEPVNLPPLIPVEHLITNLPQKVNISTSGTPALEFSAIYSQ